MEMITQYLPLAISILSIIGALTLLSTLIVRLTPSPKDDELVGDVASFWLKVMHYLPTIGINPQTQKLQEALEEALSNQPKAS